MRQTWEAIQEIYPNQWTLMKDVDWKNGRLISAVVLHACKDEWDINRFMKDNPDKLAYSHTTWYTGPPIDEDEYIDDNGTIELAEYADRIY